MYLALEAHLDASASRTSMMRVGVVVVAATWCGVGGLSSSMVVVHAVRATEKKVVSNCIT
jgi:hypothetical protein